MQHSLEALGEICGREGSEACEHHLKVIKEWGDIPDVSALRRFLGTFNWVRGHFPKEVQAVLPYLNAALKKDAIFPLNGEQLRAKRAIQELACRCIRLAAIDMVDIVLGYRPFGAGSRLLPLCVGGGD